MSPAERLAVRQQRSAPLVDGFTWVKALVPTVRPRSKLGAAVGYAISQEPDPSDWIRGAGVLGGGRDSLRGEWWFVSTTVQTVPPDRSGRMAVFARRPHLPTNGRNGALAEF